MAAEKNRPSFYLTHGESIAPGRLQMLQAVEKGFAEKFPDRASAEKQVGQCHPAPLGNVRKRKKGGSG